MVTILKHSSNGDYCTLSDLDLVFESPLRLTDITSWHGHIPFAFYLVKVLKPRLFVELGTHKGDSYCAFCQAVQALNLTCDCFAVDIWKGDCQAGYYGEEVFQDLREFNDDQFGEFSRLVRSTFDDALSLFSDKSIDLLHVDGCHSYEAVKNDVASWLPKMSNHGVILLHDIHERGPGFGVWKLWEELIKAYPAFDFYHSHGLGVLFVGKKMPPKLEPLFSHDDKHSLLVRNFFGSLGEKIVLEEKVKELNEKLGLLISMAEEHKQMIESRDAKLEKLMKKVADLENGRGGAGRE